MAKKPAASKSKKKSGARTSAPTSITRPALKLGTQQKGQMLKLFKFLEQQHGPGVIGYGNYRPDDDRISYGFLALDVETCGGAPRGRIEHWWGRPSAAKSYLAKMLCAQVQRRCICGSPVELTEEWRVQRDAHNRARCLRPGCKINTPMEAVWLMKEGPDKEEWDADIGILTEDIIIGYPDSAESTIDVVDSLLRTHQPLLDGRGNPVHEPANPPGIIVIDSIASLTPRSELYSAAGDSKQRAQGANAQQDLVNKVQSALCTKPFGDWHYTIVICLNQIRVQFTKNPKFPAVERPKAGWALQHHAALGISFRQVERVAEKKNGPLVRQRNAFYIEKNKTGSPWRGGEFEFWTDTDKLGQPYEDPAIIHYGVHYKVIERSGQSGHLKWENIKANGEDNFLAALHEAGRFWELREAVLKEAVARIRGHEDEFVPPEDGTLAEMAFAGEVGDQQ